MLSDTPLVSVLLPVHNGADYIESAVRSMMDQTLRDQEILVVDDASTDATPAILAGLAAEDSRIRILRPKKNLRLPKALNFGLDHARGRYVARMDADDLSEPTRLEVQVRYLEAHPEVTLVGCSEVDIDGDGRELLVKNNVHSAFCTRWAVRFIMPFRHPSFVFRREQMTLRYDPQHTLGQDYDFMERLTQTHKVVCLPDVLLRYRKHVDSATVKHRQRSLAMGREIAERAQARDLPPEIYDDLTPFRDAFYGEKTLDPAELSRMFRGLKAMYDYDRGVAPEHGSWVARQIVRLTTTALTRSGEHGLKLRMKILRHGPYFALPMGMWLAEKRNLLPGFLDSRPTV